MPAHRTLFSRSSGVRNPVPVSRETGMNRHACRNIRQTLAEPRDPCRASGFARQPGRHAIGRESEERRSPKLAHPFVNLAPLLFDQCGQCGVVVIEVEDDFIVQPSWVERACKVLPPPLALTPTQVPPVLTRTAPQILLRRRIPPRRYSAADPYRLRLRRVQPLDTRITVTSRHRFRRAVSA